MDNPSTTPAGLGGAGSAGSLPGTQERSGRGDVGQTSGPGISRPGGGADDAERLAKQGAEQIGREARELKDSVKQGAAGAAESARQVAGQTAEQVKRQAGQLASQFREKGAALVDQQKGRAADLIGDCVAATRRAAQKLHDENDHNLAGYADAFAQGLDRTGQYLREQDARKLVDDAADLARRRPEWVLGGAFVVGLAVARFLKASRSGGAAYGSYRYDRPDEFDYGDDAGYRGNLAGGQFGGVESGAGLAAGSGYAGGYGGAGGYGDAAGVREYNPPLTSPGDTFGAGSGDDLTSNLAGTSPGTLDAPAITTTATGSWAATGGSPSGSTGGSTAGATGGIAPAGSGPDPTLPGSAASSSFDSDTGSAQRDNPGGPLT